jgi:hypothetical protein
MSSIEAIALPSELRSSHDFAGTAKPILDLAMAQTPPPLRPEHQAGGTLDLALSVPGPNETDFHIESHNDEHDPPFRAPAIWHTSSAPAQPPRRGLLSLQWSERSTAAFLGFAAGMLIIVPTVFYISLETNPHAALKPAPIEQPVKFATADPNPIQHTINLAPVAATNEDHIIATAGVANGQWVDSRLQPRSSPPTTSLENIRPPAITEAETTALALLADGRLAEARTALRAAASPDAPRLWFILAETYDPLIANGGNQNQAETPTSANLTAADIKFANYYYHQALTHGVADARQRIEALANH